MSLTRIVHISDPHFGTTTDQKISALVEKIKELKPDAIALSGDITQRAHHNQFFAAKEFCQSLADFKIVAVPGNHDIPLFNLPARALLPYFHFKNTFGFPLNSQLNLGVVELLGLNTTHPKRHIQGELYHREILRLSNFTAKAKVRIVMFHHPLDCAQKTDEKNLLINGQDALPHLEKAQVDIVLSGHIHDPLARLSSDRYPQGQRPMVLAVAGTCLSSRTRSGAPNSFNFLEISNLENLDLKIVRYDLTNAGQFQPLSEVQFRRDNILGWRAH